MTLRYSEPLHINKGLPVSCWHASVAPATRGIRGSAAAQLPRLGFAIRCCREIGDESSDARAPPTLFLHGVPSQSYSFLPVRASRPSMPDHCDYEP